MSASMEVMPPGGHETYATSIFSKIKTYLDSNPYGYVSKSGDTMTGNLTAPKFIGNLQGTADYAASMAEANLTWGGSKNFTNSYGCIDAALMDELGANRFQFIKASAITVEYSRDNGETWTDYGATDAQKQQIFAQGGGLIIGKADSTNKATEHPGLYQLRITIDTGVAGVYSYLHKFIVYVSSGGSANCACKIQKALQSTPTTFVDHTDWISVGGWSGYNVLNTRYLPTYGNSPSGQYGRVRFIFKDGEGGNTNYNGLGILQIKAFGGVGWITPSTMAKTGHLYSYDQNQDATFPANVTATKFIGALQGNASTASKLGSSNVGSATQPIYLNGGTATACTYTLGKSVPSNAVFTDAYVTQTATDGSSNAEYEVLFSGTADNTTRTEGTRKTSLFTFNPQTNQVTAGHFTAKSSDPSGIKTASLVGYDVQLGGTSNTWDGTNTSLKSSISSLRNDKVNRGGDTMTGNLTAPKFIGALQGNADTATCLNSAGTNTQSTSSTAFATGALNVRWFTASGKIPGQPSQYGFLLTLATGTGSGENHQIFVEQPNGNLFHRGTNTSSSSSPPAFKKILDSSNYTSYTRNSSGVIKVKSVNKTPTNAGTSLASPTPSIDAGYKFLCWLYIQSNNYVVGANYPGGAANPSATWWFANGYLANYALTFYYLEIKDTI